MKDWYLRQNQRDRMIVIGLGVLVVLGFLYAVAWYPLQTKLSRVDNAVATKTETLSFMREAAARIKASGGAKRDSKTTNKAVFQFVEEIRVKHDLVRADRIDPSGEDGARIQFSSVKFDSLVKMLAELEVYGINVSTINITRKDDPGIVSVRINVERG
ncbi:MAG: type II secretion system protein M [Gammaproteobacteria bacterium]|nr:type II secretion system protein M [Gammaproteobacteria bacterium]